jgi:hypothetical protein
MNTIAALTYSLSLLLHDAVALAVFTLPTCSSAAQQFGGLLQILSEHGDLRV